MRSLKWFTTVATAAMTVLSLAFPSIVFARPNGGAVCAKSCADELTRKAIQLYEQNQTEQAIDLQKQTVKRKRQQWLPHAVLSYFLWQDNKAGEALVEGKRAARLAPGNPTPLINLGIMEQQTGDQPSAIDSFSKARTLAPNNCSTWLGEVQSLNYAGRGSEAVAILNNVAAQGSNEFTWYYELSKAYSWMGRPAAAAEAASKAMPLANSTEQKSTGLFLSFMAFLRDNQTERANQLKHQVFFDNKPTDALIYIRATSSLVPVLNPGAAQEILNAAIENLTTAGDADTFFRLAKIYQEKASYVSFDRTKYGAWLNNQERAYRQAIKLSPDTAIYHVAMAVILGEKGNTEEMTEELVKAHATEPQDQLTGYLLSKFKPIEIAATGEQPSLSNASAPQIHLTEAQISIKGLSCACKRSIIANSFRQIRGLVQTTISAKVPFKAVVLIDQSMIPITDALVEMTKKKPFQELSYELISSTPIESAAEALKIDVDNRQLSYLSDNDFSPLKPMLPVNSRY